MQKLKALVGWSVLFLLCQCASTEYHATGPSRLPERQSVACRAGKPCDGNGVWGPGSFVPGQPFPGK